MIKPLLHRILVKQDKLEDTDESFKRAKHAGLVIPDLSEQYREQAAVDTGTVVAIGETAFKDFGVSNVVSVGDYVSFAKYAGKILTDPETKEKYVILNDEDILTILSKGA